VKDGRTISAAAQNPAKVDLPRSAIFYWFNNESRHLDFPIESQRSIEVPKPASDARHLGKTPFLPPRGTPSLHEPALRKHPAYRHRVSVREIPRSRPARAPGTLPRRHRQRTHPPQAPQARRQQRGLHAAGPQEPPEQLEWTRTKRALHQVLCTANPEFEAIRQRLRNQAGALTPHLLATLSLWLAGFFGMSLATVTPLVATVLFGIARDGIDGWFHPAEPLSA